MAKRKKVLGIPVGKKKKSSGAPKAIAAGAGLAALPAVVLPAAKRASKLVSSGKKTAHQVSDVADTASNVKDAVSSKSSALGKAGAVVGELRKLGGGGAKGPKLSHLIEEHKEVAVPRSVAYNQWTQFETFPSITKGAESVEQKGRGKVQWTSKIGPSRRSWSGEITEQVPDERIAFRSKGGLQLKGVVTFHSLDRDLTRILVQMEYDPSGPVEHVGNLLRIQRRRVRRDLRLYKHFLELRNEETGAWRGRIGKKADLMAEDDGGGSGDGGSGEGGEGGDGEDEQESKASWAWP